MSIAQKPVFLLLSTVFISSIGQIFLKIGVRDLGGIKLSAAFWNEILRAATSPALILGFACYGISAYLTLVALSKVDLGVFSLFTCLNYVIVVGVSVMFLGESFSALKISGAILAVFGVYLILIG